MSSIKRVISGSIASWTTIFVTLFTQFALVPIYLTHWDAKMFGIWLAILALIEILTTLDLGHQTFLGFEFLRHSESKPQYFKKLLWSGVLFGVLLGLFQILVVLLLFKFDFINRILNLSEYNQKLISEINEVIIFNSIVWLFVGSIGGILNRSLHPFGYYPRLAWWVVLFRFVVNFVPCIQVFFGATLFEAGIGMGIAKIIVSIPIFIEMIRLLSKEKIAICKPSFGLGLKNFLLSLSLFGKELLDKARGQGVRLILGPITGPKGLSAFATMRTGSNALMQGLGTITNPLMPELMRFLNNRDQERSEASFGTVWIIIIAIIAPGVILMQIIIEPIFNIWTRNQVEFDPALFAILSLGVLIKGVAQPATSVVKGNNILLPQIVIEALAAIIVVSCIFFLVPTLGLVGAGIALLIAEIMSLLGYQFYANSWLSNNRLKWPQMQYKYTIISVLISSIALFLIVTSMVNNLIIIFVSIMAFTLLLYLYWKSLPLLVKSRIYKIRNSFSKFK